MLGRLPGCRSKKPAASATPRPSRTPGNPLDQFKGSPITGDTIEQAFFDAGFDISASEGGVVYPGVSRDGFPVRAQKIGRSFSVVIFVYPSVESLKEDWRAENGKAPEPQKGVNPPPYLTAWWNINTIVLLKI